MNIFKRILDILPRKKQVERVGYSKFLYCVELNYKDLAPHFWNFQEHKFNVDNCLCDDELTDVNPLNDGTIEKIILFAKIFVKQQDNITVVRIRVDFDTDGKEMPYDDKDEATDEVIKIYKNF